MSKRPRAFADIFNPSRKALFPRVRRTVLHRITNGEPQWQVLLDAGISDNSPVSRWKKDLSRGKTASSRQGRRMIYDMSSSALKALRRTAASIHTLQSRPWDIVSQHNMLRPALVVQFSETCIATRHLHIASLFRNRTLQPLRQIWNAF